MTPDVSPEVVTAARRATALALHWLRKDVDGWRAVLAETRADGAYDDLLMGLLSVVEFHACRLFTDEAEWAAFLGVRLMEVACWEAEQATRGGKAQGGRRP